MKDQWLNAGSGVNGCAYQAIFGKNEARADIYISGASQEKSKKLFDYLEQRQNEIETVFGGKLIWERMDDKIASRIRNAKSFDGYNEENWPEMIDWIYDNMSRLEQAFKPVLDKYKG